MKREIKFRGKRVDNGKWVYGDLIHGVNHKRDKMFILPVQGGVIPLGHGIDPLDGYEVIPETVGQYIGKGVYEDDIVKVPIGKKPVFHIGTVVYEGCGFIANLSGSDWYDLIDCEAIGNVHDNPEP